MRRFVFLMVLLGAGLIFALVPVSATSRAPGRDLTGLLASGGSATVERGAAASEVVELETGRRNELVDEDPHTVYITRTGKKYHRGTCRYLSKSKIPILLKDAILNYGPCSVCAPPMLERGSGSTTKSKKTPAYGGRCQAITKKGTQCKRNAQAGRPYCWQHER